MSSTAVGTYGDDLYTEPAGDPDTLSHLGPLAGLAGVWQGTMGADAHPELGGTERNTFVERYEAQPIDRQTNGPQLFYGLRYHTHIVKPGEVETFHDQVGGTAEPDATEFHVEAAIGTEVYGILSNPFLDQAFRTLSYRMNVQLHPDDIWSYEEVGMLQIPDRDDPFPHTDHNTLTRVGPPTPNPLAQAAAADGSLGIGNLRSESRIVA
jgi:hypothetical protein